jgi:hypothetical protein
MRALNFQLVAVFATTFCKTNGVVANCVIIHAMPLHAIPPLILGASVADLEFRDECGRKEKPRRGGARVK